jgi:hypothetical protein
MQRKRTYSLQEAADESSDQRSILCMSAFFINEELIMKAIASLATVLTAKMTMAWSINGHLIGKFCFI